MGYQIFQRQTNNPVTPAAPLRVAQLTRPLPPIPLNLPLGKALHALRQQGVPWLPVLEGAMLAGCLTEHGLAQRLVEDPGRTATEIVAFALEPPPTTLDADLSLPDAVSVFTESGASMLPVVSPDGIYQGCVTLADVSAALAGRLYPPRVGGMATPLGVYLTTGTVSGGVGDLGLVLSGMMMALMLTVTMALLMTIFAVTYHFTGSVVAKVAYLLVVGENVLLDPSIALLFQSAISALLFLIFLLLMRFVPLLSGYHAAEHQTVHAMEAGEPLTPEAVARMPRVHPRCGTNLWAIVQLSYVGLAALAMWLTTDAGYQSLGLLMPVFTMLALSIMFAWRTLGGWLQQYFTTRPATRREIESGIRAGQEIIRQHLAAPASPPPPLWRIWRMGLLQAAFGIALMWYVLEQATGVLDRLLYSLLK
jgi:CBS domain-containing protein